MRACQKMVRVDLNVVVVWFLAGSPAFCFGASSSWLYYFLCLFEFSVGYVNWNLAVCARDYSTAIFGLEERTWSDAPVIIVNESLLVVDMCIYIVSTE